MEERIYQPSLLWALAREWYLNESESVGDYAPHELTVYIYRTDRRGAYRLCGPKLYWTDEPFGQYFSNVSQDDMLTHANDLGEVVMYDSRTRKTTVIAKTYADAWQCVSNAR
jgi:hypothetical protein